MNDDDDANLPDGAQGGPMWSTSSGDGISWFAQGDFLLAPIRDPESASPSTESWGRIKAQF